VDVPSVAGTRYDKMDVVQPGVVLFDLDGTLTASGPGITRSVAAALKELGLPALDADSLVRFIGPPLLDSFRDIAGLDEITALEAVAAYRSYFVEFGMFENAVYPGIPGLLRELVDTGRRLAVTTSKPLPYAVPIIEHFALAEYFEAVLGPAIDGDGTDKGAVVAQALALLGVELDDVVLCTHADVVQELLEDLIRRRIVKASQVEIDKASTWVIEVEDGSPVGARYIPAP